MNNSLSKPVILGDKERPTFIFIFFSLFLDKLVKNYENARIPRNWVVRCGNDEFSRRTWVKKCIGWENRVRVGELHLL